MQTPDFPPSDPWPLPGHPEAMKMELPRLFSHQADVGKEEEHEPPILVAAPDQQPLPPDQRAERLTHREQEIALCVARGLTNRQIAQELSISERTVENHIAKILKKQGFSSRTRIATWVAQR